MRIEIVNGHVIDPQNGLDQQGSLYIAEGKIIGMMQAPDGFTADTSINAQGHTVCPGFVDLSARLREPGQSHKATMKSETRLQQVLVLLVFAFRLIQARLLILLRLSN